VLLSLPTTDDVRRLRIQRGLVQLLLLLVPFDDFYKTRIFTSPSLVSVFLAEAWMTSYGSHDGRVCRRKRFAGWSRLCTLILDDDDDDD
jgi:hypothetical protein